MRELHTMRCPFCGHMESSVVDSRLSAAGDVTRRRRACDGCGRRFTTYERVEEAMPTVVKKDGRREPYDRAKLVAGLRVACAKRPVSAERIEAIADAVERDIEESGEREVAAARVGEAVMARLRETDEVAYVRFASVYKQFRDAGEFAAEIGTLARARGRD